MDPLCSVIGDMQKESDIITIECGPTATGPLYHHHQVAFNPISTLFLTRYRGPILREAVGPKFPSKKLISETFKRVSSVSEPAEDGKGGTWTFE